MNEERKNQQASAEPSLSEILQVRRDKLKALQDAGRDPFVQTRFERSAYAHQKLGDVCDLIRRAVTARGTLGKHILIEVAARAVELVERKRRDDDAGGDIVQACAALASLDRLRHDALFVAALDHLVGVQRVADVLGLQKVQFRQFFCGSGCQQQVLLHRQGGHTPA